MSDYLYENENDYNDAREFYEGNDYDNWENEQVFQDNEGMEDWGDEEDSYDPGEYEASDEDDVYGWADEDDGRWDE